MNKSRPHADMGDSEKVSTSRVTFGQNFQNKNAQGFRLFSIEAYHNTSYKHEIQPQSPPYFPNLRHKSNVLYVALTAKSKS